MRGPLARLYRACTRAFPAEFREEHGAAMEATFHEVVERARRSRGRGAAAGVALAEAADVLVRGARARLSRRRPTPGFRAPPRGSGVGTTLSDVRFALRGFARQPAFTAAVLLTLALGIGANTAIFTVVRGVLLRPLPYPAPERLVRVHPVATADGTRRVSFSLPDFRDWRARTTSLAEMGLYTTAPSGLVLLTDGPAVELETAYVAGGFFATLGVQPALGRAFGPEADQAALRQVVLSHPVWTEHFGGDARVVGRSVTLSHLPYEVVAVMPPGFAFPGPEVEAWAPLTVIPQTSIPTELRFVRLFAAVGRLATGVDGARATEELAAVARSIEAEHPDANQGLAAAEVASLRDELVGADVERTLLLLLGAVACILLIACSNVASLLLARGSRRRSELATRVGLGAAPSRLLRQLLTESLVLGLAGGALGAPLAWWGTGVFLARSAGSIPRTGDVAVDGSVLLFTLLATLGATALFGALPAARVVRELSLRDAVGSGTRSEGAPARGITLRRALVAAQVGLAVVLVSGAGLLVRSLDALREVDPGFEVEGLVALHLTVSATKYPSRAEYLDVYHRLMAEVARAPGVRSVGSVRYLPLEGAGEVVRFRVPDVDAAEGAERSADLIQVSEGLFATLGTALLAGRGFAATDRAEDPAVAVVNAAFVREHLAGTDPLGRTVDFGAEARVVGVVEDVRHHRLDQPATPTIYVHQEQFPRRGMAVVARVDGDARARLADLRGALEAVDPEQPVALLTVVRDAVEGSIARPRFVTLLLGSFAGLALLLAAVGIHGVVAYHVGERRREIGIRMALGARARETVLAVARQGVLPALVGVAAGVGGALLLSRLAESLLFEVRPTDPFTYAVVVLALLGVTLAASILPARHATRIHPSEALRAQ